MPEIMTRDFGPVPYSEDEIFDFAGGLPGFPDCERFLTVRPNPDEPLVVLQSLERPEVAFLTIPLEALAGAYELRIREEDRRALGAAPGSLYTLVIVTLPSQGAATVNLLGPIVLHPATRRGIQAIRDDNRYGAAEPFDLLLDEHNPGEVKERALCS